MNKPDRLNRHHKFHVHTRKRYIHVMRVKLIHRDMSKAVERDYVRCLKCGKYFWV